MNAAQFPRYMSERAARQQKCFQCVAPFTDTPARDSGNPDGRGRWALVCSLCGMSTFFDVAPWPFPPTLPGPDLPPDSKPPRQPRRPAPNAPTAPF